MESYPNRGREFTCSTRLHPTVQPPCVRCHGLPPTTPPPSTASCTMPTNPISTGSPSTFLPPAPNGRPFTTVSAVRPPSLEHEAKAIRTQQDYCSCQRTLF